MPEWQANAEGHWQVCADCNTKSKTFDHVPGPEATETEPQICTECNFRIKMELSHVHDYNDSWYSDENDHWQSCVECAEATPMEPHTWDAGFQLEDGSYVYTCTICNMERNLTEQLPTEPDTAPTQPTKPNGKDSSTFRWQWAGIAAIVLMVIGVALLVIEFIRSRKTNMHGRFSK